MVSYKRDHSLQIIKGTRDQLWQTIKGTIMKNYKRDHSCQTMKVYVNSINIYIYMSP